MADRFGRPEWDDYFMAIAMVVTTKSLDSNTKHATLLVDDHHRIVSIGYNGPPRGIDDSLVTQERPDKYYFFEHGERNAIYNAARMGLTLKGCTLYVLGHPCADCARAIIQSGIIEVVYGAVRNEAFEDRWKKSIDAASWMFSQAGVKVRRPICG